MYFIKTLAELFNHSAFRSLAGKKWYSYQQGENGLSIHTYTSTLNRDQIDILNIAHKERSYHELISLVKILESGPKVFEPSVEDCISLEKIDVRVKLSEYRQPYEVMMVDFPENYRNHLKSRFDCKIPFGGIIHHNSEIEFISISLYYGVNEEVINFFVSKRSNDPTLEDSLEYGNKNKGSEFELARLVERVIINAMLMLCHFGHEQSNVEEIKKLKRIANHHPQTKLNYLIAPRIIKLKRSFKSEGYGTHESPSPHWRRGHWRVQHFGPSLNQSKVIFIKSVFVNGNATPQEIIYKR